MKIAKFTLMVVLSLVTLTVSAEDKHYLFDIKLFDITDVSNGLQTYQTLEPFSNPKMVTREKVASYMNMSGDNKKELNFELKLLAKVRKALTSNLSCLRKKN